jgi:DNA-directed RNA polymerase subunit K/omega
VAPLEEWEWGLKVAGSSSETTSKEKKVLIGPPKLTRFERARIVGARALQIAMGAPILIEQEKAPTNPIDIALQELEIAILPITIRRTLPDETYEDIPLKWLLEG